MAVEPGGGRRGAAPGSAAPVVAAASVAILIWAGTAAATRAVVADIDPLMVGAFRTIGASAIAVPLILRCRLGRPRSAGDWTLLLLSAFGSFAVFPLLFSIGAARTSASHASLIQAVMPIFTGFIALATERRRPTALWWLGAAVACGGEALLVALRDQRQATTATAWGDVLVLVACLASAAGYVAGGRLAMRITPLAAAFWTIGVASLALAPLALWRAVNVAWGALGTADWALLLYLALGSTLIAFIAWFWALAHGGIARVALLQFAQPVLSVAFAAVLLGEPVTLPLVLAGVAILAGIAIARRSS